MSTETATLLRNAKALIEDLANWTTRELARDANGNPCSPTAPEACKFCAIGALQRARRSLGSISNPIYRAARAALDNATALPSESVPYTNDYKGHGAVLRLFDKAIASEETKG